MSYKVIQSKAPIRVSLSGGGTDFFEYYSKKKSTIVTTTLNKYIYVDLRENASNFINIKYWKTERVSRYDVKKIEHPFIRECLIYFSFDKPVNIEITSDIPHSCGMGTSAALLVALIGAISKYKAIELSKDEVARVACEIEISIMKRNVGIQDQYASAFGGIMILDVNYNGDVNVEKIQLSENELEFLNDSMLIYYTGMQRDASTVLKEQVENLKKNSKDIMFWLDKIKENSIQTKKIIKNRQLDKLGEKLHIHWNIKSKLGNRVSTSFIDEIYNEIRSLGVQGGKLLGAGNGGYLLLFIRKNQEQIRMYLEEKGLKELKYSFDDKGLQVVTVDALDMKIEEH